MKKALVISCFFSKGGASRPYQAYEYLKKEYDVEVLYSLFSHSSKNYIEKYEDINFIPIKPIKYDKNISLRRIISHIDFGIKAKKIVKKKNIDLIYVAVPANIVGYLVVKVAKSKGIKVIVDIVDIWPEALPIPTYLKKVLDWNIFRSWRYMRNWAISNCDIAISESYYFNQKINNNKINVIHLSKPHSNILDLKSVKLNNKLLIAYLGSINNIYDFEGLIKICKIIKDKGKNIQLEIIGDGERKDWLINQLEINNINYKYYGKIYCEAEKYDILKNVHFGFNGYKGTTEVALSYKSIDYLSYGVPLLNSTKGDTKQIIDQYMCGMNYDHNNLEKICENIISLSDEEFKIMKQKSYDVFLKYFSQEVYESKMDLLLNKL